jgi:hypothetical protein
MTKKTENVSFLFCFALHINKVFANANRKEGKSRKDDCTQHKKPSFPAVHCPSYKRDNGQSSLCMASQEEEIDLSSKPNTRHHKMCQMKRHKNSPL